MYKPAINCFNISSESLVGYEGDINRIRTKKTLAIPTVPQKQKKNPLIAVLSGDLFFSGVRSGVQIF
jgi:hypothetical protein